MSEPTDKMAPTNKRTEKDGDDDVAALIYRESQLRKAEAAVAASEKKMTSSDASTHHRRSTRKKIQVASRQNTSTVIRKSLKRKRQSLTEEKGRIQMKVGKDGRRRARCTACHICANLCLEYLPLRTISMGTKITYVLRSQ